MRRSIALWLAAAGCGRISFDPAGVDANSDGTASDCPGFAQFCDGFESGDFSAWSGSDINPGGTIVPTQAQAHSGSFALDATMPMQSNGASADVVHSFAPISSGVIAVREWIYAPQPLLSFDSPLNLYDVFGHYVLVAGATTDWALSEDSVVGGNANHYGTPLPPLNTWTCIELDVTFSPPRFELFVDDVLVVDVTPVDPAMVYREIDVGVARADIAGYRVIVDDVVQADRHIGCQ